MRGVTSAVRPLMGLIAAFAVAVALAAMDASQVSASSGGSSSGGCNPYVDGTIVPVPCSFGSWSGGSGGSGSGGSGSGGGGSSGSGTTLSNPCTTTTLDQTRARSLGLPQPPAGQTWALQQCSKTPQAAVILTAAGAPAVSPQRLLAAALGELRVPALEPSTAPPRGHDGLVGLPEWFWISAGSWRTRTVTVSAGPVWAVVTAAPVDLTFRPGPGLSPVTCAGPGVIFNPYEQPAVQHTKCSYTYVRPSIGQPGNAYRASLTVSWRVTWTGSGGAGGLLDAALPVPVSFAVSVAQGEALVTSP